MAPATRPRGRPKKVETLASSVTSSRQTSTTRASTKKASLVSENLPPPSKPSAPSTVDDEDEDDESLFDISTTSKRLAAISDGRASVSSINSAHNLNSGYSTPATSAAATPAVQSKPSTTRRGRRAAVPLTQATPAVDAVQRAAALRNSKLSLTSSIKRKRDMSEEEDADDENTADAQLARALQDAEDAAALEMNSSSMFSAIRRTPRKLQKILPKTDYLSEEEEEEAADVRSSWFSKPKPKIELVSSGANSVSFKGNKTQVIEDSEDFEDDEEDEEDEVDDSEEEYQESDSSDDVPLASRGRLALKAKVSGFDRPVQRKTTLQSKLVEKLPRSSKNNLNAVLKSKRPSKQTIAGSDDVSSIGGSDPGLESGSDLSSIKTDELLSSDSDPDSDSDDDGLPIARPTRRAGRRTITLTRIPGETGLERRARRERLRLEQHHPELHTMWTDLENLPKVGNEKIEQPQYINRILKPFQLEGVAWMKAMEQTEWAGGLLGDEMGMGKTIQAVTLIMSDFPNPQPSLVLIPPVALMQWQQEIAAYTDGRLKTFVFHGTNTKSKSMTVKDLKKFNVILMSYNSLESMYRKQEKGFKRKDGIYKEKSIIHQIQFHRVILDEAHNIKQRTSNSAKACFALKADHKWCLSGTPLQNRIGEFFSLVRFLDIKPFACYFCKQCPCSTMEWDMNDENRCKGCSHSGMQHVSVFNQELLNPIQQYGNNGKGKEAFRKLRILTDRFMLRRVKRDHSSAMELPAKEIYVDRQFFGEEENDFASSIMNNSNRKFETYVAQGVLLNNYANIFGLIMQMRQVADHPDLLLKKNGEGGQNILVCCICDEPAEEAIRSACKHDFCRECAKNYLKASDDSLDCPRCHILLSIDLEQVEIEQDEQSVKKSSIINRIKMENWTSSSKIEALVHDLYELRSKNSSSKSIIFSQFTTMLQLVEWRLRRAGITTVMLDGSMTPAQRQASINKFMTDVNIECFLVSLKAGGVALNLTEASKVFIVDPWWNPAAEWQSADRCHRIGQSRPCSITRLCIEDSVESRMVLLQEKKANMINSTLNADQAAMESLTPEDMQFLFRGS